MVLNRQFVVDSAGKRIKVILEIEEFEKLLEQLEDLEDIRAADEAKAEGGQPISLAEYRKLRAKAKK